MNNIRRSLILWIDLRYTRDVSVENIVLEERYDIHVISDSSDIDQSVEQYNPDIIFFDYDLPDQVGLSVLSDTKKSYPSIPIVMLTEDYSSELVLWALRSRVWDFFVKPVDAKEINASVESLLKKISLNKVVKRDNFMQQPVVPSTARPYKTKGNSASTILAVDYVQQHLANKITVEEVAKRCGMSKSHFSRTFKKEHDITFQQFLIQQRMNKAVELLKNTDFHVTQIAHAVGYCELSNFTSTFQRMIGIQPSSFRKALMSK